MNDFFSVYFLSLKLFVFFFTDNITNEHFLPVNLLINFCRQIVNVNTDSKYRIEGTEGAPSCPCFDVLGQE